MDVRTEILQVSLKLFNEFGSENISTNEIAKKTDISTELFIIILRIKKR